MKSALLPLLSLWLTRAALGAPFINLDFEGVSSNAMGSIQPAIHDAIPGWLYYGSTNNGINFNYDCEEYCGGLYSRAAFADPHAPIWRYFPNGLHGNYGLGFAPQPNFPATLSQRGEVPPDAKYLFLDAQYSTSASVALFMNGNLLTTYDISAYAGKTVDLELKFFAFFQSPGQYIPPTVGLDAVVFLVPPKLESVSTSMSTNGFSLSWTNDVSTRYQVEFTTNFPAKWLPTGMPVSSTNGNFTFTDTNATTRSTGQRFYRLHLAP